MKKKILARVTAAAVAATCAVAFVACDGNGDEKAHTEAQWKAAFNSAMSDGAYDFKQSVLLPSEDDNGSPYYHLYSETKLDTTNRVYVEQTYMPGVIDTDFLLKRGDRYYMSSSPYWDPMSSYYVGGQLTAEQFAEYEQRDYIGEYGGVIEYLLTTYRDNYSKFSAAGAGSESTTVADIDGNTLSEVKVDYTIYSWKNVPFNYEYSDERNYSLIVDDVKVKIDSHGALYEVVLDGMSPTGDDVSDEDKESKAQFELRFTVDINKMVSDFGIIFPDVYGNTFVFTDVRGVPDEVKEAYLDKQIVCAADGSLSGDVTIDDMSISDFKLTDSCGKITIAGGDYTLTGTVSASAYDGKVTMTLTLDIGEGNSIVFVMERVEHYE